MEHLLTITSETLEWTEGNHGALEMKLRRGTFVTVKCDKCKDTAFTASPDIDTWCRAEFSFCKPGIVVPYVIEVCSDSIDSIQEIVDILWDTKVESVLIHQCPALKSLRFRYVRHFDFKGCPDLEYLDCDYYSGRALDLTSMPQLRSLRCKMGTAETIGLSKNPNLISLNLIGCKIKSLKVSNQAHIQNLNIDSCENLKPQTKAWLDSQRNSKNEEL